MMSNKTAINILLAEDQTMLRNALATILDLEENLEVVHSCATGKPRVTTTTERSSVILYNP